MDESLDSIIDDKVCCKPFPLALPLPCKNALLTKL